jgi:Domain of unknown function (DUF4267)
MPPSSQQDAALAAAGRVAIGAAAVLAPGPTSRLLGFPRQHDSATARLMGRLFGIRDVALGVLVWQVREDRELSRFAYKLNAWVDAGDMAAAAAPLLRRRGIDRASAATAAFAFAGANIWLRLLRRTR